MSSQQILEEGINLYKQQDYTEALAFFLSLPADSGADPVDIAYYLGLCYSKLQRYDDAMLYLEQVITAAGEEESLATNERVLQCRYLLAVIYCLSGRRQLANFELENLLNTGYKTSSVYASFAYISWQQGDIEACLSYYEKSLKEDENNPTALNGMGYVLAEDGRDLAKALTLCKKALELAPESAACLDSMGWVYYKMGLFSQSRKYLEQAYQKDSKSEIIRQHLHQAEMVDK